MKTSFLAACTASAMLLSGCSTPLLNDRLTLLRETAATRLQPAQPEATAPVQPLATRWEINAAPVQFSAADPFQLADSKVEISGRATARTQSHDVPQRYEVTWTGQRRSHAETPTVITVQDAQGDRALELRFEGERLRVIAEIEDAFPKLTYSTTTPHEVILKFAMGPRPTVTVNIVQGSRPLFTSAPLPVMDRGFEAVGALSVTARAPEARYDMSGLRITPLDDLT